MKLLRYCEECGYTMKPICHGNTRSAYPPKYSPEDKYAEYRRRARNE